jgi:hypothetical protein
MTSSEAAPAERRARVEHPMLEPVSACDPATHQAWTLPTSTGGTVEFAGAPRGLGTLVIGVLLLFHLA